MKTLFITCCLVVSLIMMSQDAISQNKAVGSSNKATSTTTSIQTIIPVKGVEEFKVMLPGNVPLVMVKIPAGSFQMGSNEDATWSWCNPCEQPVHQVTIKNDFYIGKFEVTQEQWQAVMNNNPSSFKGAKKPVEQISWEDAQKFIKSLNQLRQGSFRLPSEAEWEYACRAGTTTRFYFGESNCRPKDFVPCDLDKYGWWGGNSEKQTHEVGQKLPNAYGLYDMAGNVWELCQDWMQPGKDPNTMAGYAGAPTDGSALETPEGTKRIVRGGSWFYISQYCRSANRGSLDPTQKINYVGVRVVREK